MLPTAFIAQDNSFPKFVDSAARPNKMGHLSDQEKPLSVKKIAYFDSDIPIQILLSAILFFVLTGGTFLLKTEQLWFLSAHRFLFQTLLLTSLAFGVLIGWTRFKKNPETFADLQPMHSIRWFLEIPPAYSISILCTVYFLTQFVSLCLLHAGLGTALWDLGYHDQVLWNTAHNRTFISSIRGGVNTLGDHFKPILLLLTPIYWVSDNTNLLFAVAVLISSFSLPLTYLIAKHLTQSEKTAVTFAIAVFFYLPLRNAVNFPIHSSTFADPLLLAGFYAMLKQRHAASFAFLFFAMMCKENILMEVLGIGLYSCRSNRKFGNVVIASTIACFLLIFLVVKPHFRWPHELQNFWGFYAYLLSPKLDSFKRLLQPNPLLFLLLTFGPFLFLSFRCKGWHWLLGPSLIYRLLAHFEKFRMINYHYPSGLNALVWISSMLGASESGKPPKWISKFMQALKPLSSEQALRAALLIATLGFSGIPQLFEVDRLLWDTSFGENQKIIQILEGIPKEYSVTATETYLAHLTHRGFLYGYDTVLQGSPLQEAVKNVDIAVVDEGRIMTNERKVLDDYLKRGYRSLFKMGPLVIYANPSLSANYALMEQWKTIASKSEINYRKKVIYWYKRLFILGGLIFFFAILRRSDQEKPARDLMIAK